MDVGIELDKLNVNLESLPSIDNPSDLSELEKEQIEALQLRGSWGEPNCPWAGDHVPLQRELLRGEMHAGLPMVEGPGSPELEEEDYGRELIGFGGHGDSGIGDRGKTAGGRDRGEEEDECALPRKRKWHKNDPAEWLVTGGPQETHKERGGQLDQFNLIDIYSTPPGGPYRSHQLYIKHP